MKFTRFIMKVIVFILFVLFPLYLFIKYGFNIGSIMGTLMSWFIAMTLSMCMIIDD